MATHTCTDNTKGNEYQHEIKRTQTQDQDLVGPRSGHQTTSCVGSFICQTSLKNIKIIFFIFFNVQKLYKRKENKEENVLMEEKMFETWL